METILVIGGTGNIGQATVEELAKAPDVKIKVGAHNTKVAEEMFANLNQVSTVKFDFLDAATFAESFAGVDKVFFIRPPQLAKPKQDMLPFLEYAKAQQIKQIVFVSLIGVEKNPVTPHHKIEKMIRQLGIPYTFIRPSFFMQNLNTTHQFDIKENNDLFIPAGNALTSFIDTRDIGAVAAKVLTSKDFINKTLNITGSEALSYQEIATKMTDILGKDVTYSKPSLLKFRKTMIDRGMKKEYVNVMVMLYLITQMGNAKQVTQTIPEILKRPAISIDQYINDYRNDFLK